MYEGFDTNNLMIRRTLLKLFIIVCIVLLLIFLVPKFRSFNKTNKKVKEDLEITIKDVKDNNMKENLEKLQNAGLLYFKENNVPNEKEEEKTILLKELVNNKLITNLKSSDNKKCSLTKSYVKLTKTNDEYELKTYLKCGNNADYLLTHVKNHSYCKNYLCEKDSKKKDKNETSKKDNKIINENKETKLSEAVLETKKTWTNWSNWTKTSCDTKSITCSDNSCNKEIETKKVVEKTGTYNNKYYAYELSFRNDGVKTVNTCNGFNYFILNNKLYKTTGNYIEILNINKESTSNWKYVGEVKSEVTPAIRGNEFYKFSHMDESVCNETCDKKVFVYDKYEYIKDLSLGTNACTDINNIVSYAPIKKEHVILRNEPLYEDVCYVRERTR